MRALLLFLLLVAAAAAEDEGAPGLAVAPLAPDPARDARIEELIGELPAVDRPWHGISDTSGGGVAFDAVEANLGIVPDAFRELPGSGPPAPFRDLVRLGPAAIPALLRHLDDKRETKLSFRWEEEQGLGGMFAWPDLPAGNPAERAIVVRTLGANGLKNGCPPAEMLDNSIREHAVTVGDCCLAILGQIVNRPYEAVRCQPSRITVVSSPTRDPRIAGALRALWGQGDPRQVLARSLGDELKQRICADAALRLLTYFPDEAAPLVAKRIAGISWDYYPARDDPAADYYPERDEADVNLLRASMSTGHLLIRAEWLKLLDPARPAPAQLAALAAMPGDPPEDVREKVRAMLGRASDVDLAAACIAALPGVRAPGVFARLEKELSKVERRDARKTQVILGALAALDEEESLPIFLAHIEKLGNYGWGNALVALGEAPRPRLVTAIFKSKLDVTGPVWPSPVPAPGGVTAATRWCDLAATALSRARPDLLFDPTATVEERDRQIAAIRAALAK